MSETLKCRRPKWTAVVAALVVGCGGSSPIPKVASHSFATADGVDGISNPSDELARRWPFDEPRASLLLDVRRAVDSALGRELLRRNERWLDAEQWSCLEPLLAHTHQLAGAIDERGFLILAMVDATVSLHAVGATCASAMRWLPTTMEGSSNAWKGSFEFWAGGELDLAVAQSGLLALGSRGLVERALFGREPRHASLDALQLRTSEVLAGRLGLAGALHFTSTITDESFVLRADATFADEEVAKVVESYFGPKAWARVRAALLPALESDVARALEHLFDAFHFARDGRRMNVTLELREPPRAQALDLEIAAGAVLWFAKRQGCRLRARSESTASTQPDDRDCDKDE